MPLAWPPATEIVTVGKFLLVLRSPAGAAVARPERKISSVAWRPLSGISVTCSWLMTWPTPVDRVSIIAFDAGPPGAARVLDAARHLRPGDGLGVGDARSRQPDQRRDERCPPDSHVPTSPSVGRTHAVTGWQACVRGTVAPSSGGNYKVTV